MFLSNNNSVLSSKTVSSERRGSSLLEIDQDEREVAITSVPFVTLDCNSLSPKSGQHHISPCIINALWNRVVMRITNMITQDEFT